jgi:eukaryotic-like serine/threonine-protein kinase
MPVAAPSIATEDLTTLVEGLKKEWRAGTAAPDAVGACRDFPALARNRSLFVDLAYEDYCLQEEAGAAPDVDSFCRRLPAFRSQVREVLRGHREIADHPDLFAAPVAEWPQPGDTVERLRLDRELGRGAFARVYLAHDPDADRLVALKLAPAPSVEPRTLGSLRHPHIAGLHWARPTTGNLHAMCMPFVGAATLADVVEAAFHQDRPPSATAILEAASNDEALPPVVTARMTYAGAVAAVGARLADALAHLHKAGIAHGDLKPSNVLLGSGGHPYLIDFNLANGPESSRLRCGGTLPYMAPERVRLFLDPAAGPADPIRADVYSFGALLFELTTGRVPIPPIESLDQTAVAKDLLSRTPPRVRTCRRDVPSALARLMDGCLSIDPARRPTAEELTSRLTRLSRPRRTLLRATAAAVAAVILLAGVLVWRANREPRTPAEHFERGVKLLKAHDPTTAAYHFNAAATDGRDPRAKAYMAYCAALNSHHESAFNLYQAALDEGYDEPWVRNNLAFSLLYQGKEPIHAQRADEQATLAIDRLSDPRTAYFIRARARFQLDLNRDFNVLDKLRCLDDLEKALPDGPETADQLFHVALMRTATGKGDPKTILGYLDRAVEAGFPPTGITKQPVFLAHLKKLAGFDRIAALPAPAPGDKPPVPFGLLFPSE